MRRIGLDSEHKKEYDRQYYLRNREKIIKKTNEWSKNNKDKIKKWHIEYYLKHKEKLIGVSRETYHAKPFVLRWAQRTLYSHRHDGYEVLITPAELVDIALTHSKCQFCGADLIFWNESRGKGQRYWNSVSLDRKHNGKTINKDNILILCQGCNMAKGVKTMDEFFNYCKTIVGLIEDGKITL